MPIAKDELSRRQLVRLENLTAKLKENNIETLIINCLSDIYYLTGFTGTTAFVIFHNGEFNFITDARYDIQANEQVPHLCKIHIVKNYFEEMSELIKGASVVYFTKDAKFDLVSKITAQTGATAKLDEKNLISLLRGVKDEIEVSMIKEQYRIIRDAIYTTLKEVHYGQTEREWANILDYNVKKAGGTQMSFSTIIASGIRSTMPHGVASDKIIEKGEPITLDCGSQIRYCSDITRQVYEGDNADYLHIVDVVKNAMKNAIAAAKPGVACKDIDKVARDYIKDAGFGEYFAHGLGHSLGIDIHEPPNFNSRETAILQTNNVLTVEPGIYIPKGVTVNGIKGGFGVRLEDTIRITENGAETLTMVPDYILHVG